MESCCVIAISVSGETTKVVNYLSWSLVTNT